MASTAKSMPIPVLIAVEPLYVRTYVPVVVEKAWDANFFIA